jgi:hypothetical protein
LRIPSFDMNDIPYGQSVSSGSTNSVFDGFNSGKSSPKHTSNVRFRLPAIVSSNKSPKYGSASWKIREIFNNKQTHALPKSPRLQNFVLGQSDVKLPDLLSQQAISSFNPNNYFSHTPPTTFNRDRYFKNNNVSNSKSAGHISLLTQTGEYDKRFLNLMYTLVNIKAVRTQSK